MKSFIGLVIALCAQQALAEDISQGSTSVILERCLYDQITVQRLTGLTFASPGLSIAVHRDAAPLVAYTTAAGTIEDVTTVDTTYETPSADHVRFAEVGTSGCYQLHFADSVFASGQKLLLLIDGATDLLDHDETIRLVWDFQLEVDVTWQCAQALQLAYSAGPWTNTGLSTTYFDPGNNEARITVLRTLDGSAMTVTSWTCPDGSSGP